MAHSDIFLCGQTSDAMIATTVFLSLRKDDGFNTLIHGPAEESVHVAAFDEAEKLCIMFHNSSYQKQNAQEMEKAASPPPSSPLHFFFILGFLLLYHFLFPRMNVYERHA